MPVEAVSYALRAPTRSRLGKLLLAAIVADTTDYPGTDEYVPCLTFVSRLAEIGMCSEEEAVAELHALKAGGFLTYLAIHPEGSICADPVLPAVVSINREADRG